MTLKKKQDQYTVYERHGQLVLAINSEIMIPERAPVRLLSAQLEELEYGKLYEAYSSKGRKSAADPRVLFKVLVHGYLCGIYSSRKLEEACQYRIDFRWLLEDRKAPDHSTLARFRTGRCKEAVEELFYQFVRKLEEMGETDHKAVFLDGTKLESRAGWYTFVCSRFTTTGHSTCSWHRIYEISLTTLVLNEIKAHSEMVKQDEAAVLDKLKRQLLSESAAKQEDSKLEISRLRRRIGELEHMTAKLYEDKVSGAIHGDTFSVLIQKSEQERIQKADRLDTLLAEERKVQQEVENIHQWADTIRPYLDLQELDREIVEELIDHIEIGERSVIDGQRHQDIKIFYRFVGMI